MQVVIDQSVMGTEAVVRFLEKSKSNIVIISQQNLAETFATKTLYPEKKLRVLQNHIQQVRFALPPSKLIKLKGNTRGLRKKLLFNDTSLQLKSLFNALDRKPESNFIETSRIKADKMLHEIYESSYFIAEGMLNIRNSFTEHERRQINTNKPNDQIIRKLVDYIHLFSVRLFKSKALKLPNSHQLCHTYTFRVCLAFTIYTFDRLRKGGITDSKPIKNMANDLTDLHNIALATFFDDLMAGDEKQKERYNATKIFLDKFIELYRDIPIQ